MRENKIICGAMPEATKVFPDGYFNCCISSPPYWALRDYVVEPSVWDGDKKCRHKWDGEIIRRDRGAASGRTAQTGTHKKGIQGTHTHQGQFCSKCGAWLGALGLEPTFELYIKHLCDIYDEVKRVLRDDGCCFVNLGDTYNNNPSNQQGKGIPNSGVGLREGARSLGRQNRKIKSVQQKSLCLIPQRFAIEMVNRGWILRNTIIWHKPNPMPSSAKDRFTVDFEYVFFFVKSNKPTYYINPRKMRSSGTQKYDYIWVHRNTGLEVYYQPFSDRLCKGKKRLWKRRNLWEGRDYWFEPQYEPVMESTLQRDKYTRILAQDGPQAVRHNHETPSNPLGRNKRTVWTIPTQAYPDAHFATFPEKLVEPMIKAGCPEFVCTKCGKAREKILKYVGEKTWVDERKGQSADSINVGTRGLSFGRKPQIEFKGYTDCGCGADWRPGRILDCFCRKLHHRQGSRQAA